MLKLLKLRLLQHNLFESITYKHTYVHVLGAGCGHFRIIFMITPSSKCWKSAILEQIEGYLMLLELKMLKMMMLMLILGLLEELKMLMLKLLVIALAIELLSS